MVIAAHTYAQAQDVAVQERLMPGWVYLRGPETLQGMRGPAVLCLDGWEQNPALRGRLGLIEECMVNRDAELVGRRDLDPWRGGA